MTRFEFKERKRVRAIRLAQIISDSHYRGCVCFSCGNAANELSKCVFTVRVCPAGDFQTVRWWKGEEIHNAFPDLLDATSGHLPMWIMRELATAYRLHLNFPHEGETFSFETGETYLIPTGSGETIVALAMAFPDVRFRAEYNTNIATAFQASAPLNSLVEALTNK